MLLILLGSTGCRFSVDALQDVGPAGDADLAMPADGAVRSDPVDLGAPDDLTAPPVVQGDMAQDPCAGAPPPAAGAIGAQCVIGNPPTIDGDLSDWPQGSFLGMTSTTAAQAEGSWGGPLPDDEDSSARFAVRWDLTNLYVAVSITDDIRETPNAPPGLSDNDALEIFVDGNHDRTTSYGSDDWQLVYSADGQKAAARVSLVSWPTGAHEAWGGTSPSFTVEAAIPWSALGGSAAAPGRIVGFDLKLDDNDEKSKTTRDRDLVMYYVQPSGAGAPSCAAPYCRTDVFGAVQLQGR
ncbi:MAG TPA: sugar-binding protein [Polyangia bacterium]|nr:sugar-binding protein [Polyangia bacterium]